MRLQRCYAGVSIPVKISMLLVFWHQHRFVQNIFFHLYFYHPAARSLHVRQLSCLF